MRMFHSGQSSIKTLSLPIKKMVMDYTPQLQEHLKQMSKEFTSTCSFPEAIYNIIFVEKLTPEKVRNQLMYADYIGYIKDNRYGKAYIYQKLSDKYELHPDRVRKILAQMILE